MDTGAYLGPDETAVASWVQKNNKHAGATTNTLPNAKCLYLAVRGEGSALAVAGIAIEEGREPDAFEKNLVHVPPPFRFLPVEGYRKDAAVDTAPDCKAKGHSVS